MSADDELERLIAAEREATDLPGGPPAGGYERLAERVNRVGPEPTPAPSGWPVDATSWKLLGLVVVVLVGLGASAISTRDEARRERIHAPTPVADPRSDPPRLEPPMPVATPVVPAQVDDGTVPTNLAPVPGSAPRDRRERTQPVDDLDAELALLQRARSALRQGDTAAALELAREHARLFPNGSLAPERRAIFERVRCMEASAEGPRPEGCP